MHIAPLSPSKIALCAGCNRTTSSCIGANEFLAYAPASAPAPSLLTKAALFDELSWVRDDLDACNREIDALESGLNANRRGRNKLEGTAFGNRSTLLPLHEVQPAGIAAVTPPEG